MANQVVQVVLRSEAASETQHLGNWSSCKTKTTEHRHIERIVSFAARPCVLNDT